MQVPDDKGQFSQRRNALSQTFVNWTINIEWNVLVQIFSIPAAERLQSDV
jgi:hypothetical protein